MTLIGDGISALAALPSEERAQAISKIGADNLRTHWQSWAHVGQLAPAGEWRTWLLLAGRGFGKTRAGAEWVRAKALGLEPLGEVGAVRIALVGETIAETRHALDHDAADLGNRLADERDADSPHLAQWL